MTKPLALVLYQQLLPGSQLVNRLQDLGYRVSHLSDPAELAPAVEREHPIVLLTDLQSTRGDVVEAIRGIRSGSETRHVAVLAFCPDDKKDMQEQAAAAGADLVAGNSAVLNHLPQLLEQALRVE